jgi:hypothetical protein
MGAKVMKKELNCLVSKRWEKVRSTPHKQESDLRREKEKQRKGCHDKLFVKLNCPKCFVTKIYNLKRNNN